MQAMQSRRRCRLPARATNQPSATRCPSDRTRSTASPAQPAVNTAHSVHAHPGTPRIGAAAISATPASVGTNSARVHLRRAAAGPCRRSGPAAASVLSIRSVSTAVAVSKRTWWQQHRRLALAMHAGHHCVQPSTAQ
ncbi:predicted protein [Mycobacterium tuberculosis GM 1503]|nr:predicted protein [Mycobacterium tuberculosis GM 1503]